MLTSSRSSLKMKPSGSPARLPCETPSPMNASPSSTTNVPTIAQRIETPRAPTSARCMNGSDSGSISQPNAESTSLLPSRDATLGAAQADRRATDVAGRGHLVAGGGRRDLAARVLDQQLALDQVPVLVEGQRLDLVHVVGGHPQRHPATAKLGQQVADPSAVLLVHAGGRLV